MGKSENLIFMAIASKVMVTVQIFGAAVLVRDYVGEIAFCTGESMLPTLRTRGDVLLIDKTFLALGKPLRHGDVVVVSSPTDPSRLICKRVVGLPGDIVWGRRSATGILPMAVKIPRGHVWIEGDNPERSQDSRFFGSLPQSLVRGRALCKVCLLAGLSNFVDLAPSRIWARF